MTPFERVRGELGAVKKELAYVEAAIQKLTERLALVGAQRDELLSAVKGYRIALRPWLDAASGKGKGTVTYAEWNTAVDRLEVAITKAGLK